MTKNITLKDVASRAGVSYQTVSKLIRNQIQVSPEVQTRVQTAIIELGYRPNAAAQNLRTQVSHCIGYSWQPEKQNDYNHILQQFQHSIVDWAETFGYHILLFPQRSDRDLRTTYEELVYAHRVDGFVLSSVEYNDPRIACLNSLKVPFVCFGRPEEHGSLPYVDVDNRRGIEMVVKHLIEQGHTRIAVLAWPEQSRVGDERLAGYWDAMREANLPVDPKWVIQDGRERDYGYDATKLLLNFPTKKRPTAIVTLLDTIAIGVIQAVQDCGFEIGRDIGITGFDDMPIAQYVKPALTTLRQPVWDVGQAVIKLLMQLLAGEKPIQPQLMLSPELIIRESSLGYRAPPSSSLPAKQKGY